MGVSFYRTSQGLDAYIGAERVGAIVYSPVLDVAFYKSTAGMYHAYPSVQDAVGRIFRDALAKSKA